MKIQDVEAKTGLDRATIRFYEKEALVVPRRLENGYRDYTDEDVLCLLKVKLLRQLGVSLLKIKCLQQGSEDFSKVLAQQIELLEQQIQSDTRAKLVCVEIRNAGEEYQSLDAAQYLKMLNTSITDNKRTFREPVKTECHPWRRYFARTIDYAVISAIITFIPVCVFRIRPFSPAAIKVLSYGSFLIATPILALFIQLFGTTPGKWAMGIRVESANGGKLTFSDAFYRELAVLWYGLGLQIPVYSLWRLYKSYSNDTEGEGNCWNEDSELIYTDWTILKKAAIAILCAVSFVTNMAASFDTMLPKYRGNGITLEQFVDNYNVYEKSLEHQSQYILSDDGKWIEQTGNRVYITIGEDHERPDFSYEFDNGGNLISISFKDQWNDANMMDPIPAFCSTAVYAVIGSRPGATYKDIIKAEEHISNEIYQKLVQEAEDESFIGEFQVKDVKVTWDMEITNCDYVTDYGMMISMDDQEISYVLIFKIEILK